MGDPSHESPLAQPNDPRRSLLEKQHDALTECDRLIQHFKRQSQRNKRRFNLLKYCCISLTVVVTILSGLAAAQQIERWEWLVPLLSGLGTLTTTLLGQTSTQKLWIQARTVQQRLHAERFLYLQGAGGYADLNDEEQVRRFSSQVVEIWSQGHESWSQSISDHRS